MASQKKPHGGGTARPAKTRKRAPAPPLSSKRTPWRPFALGIGVFALAAGGWALWGRPTPEVSGKLSPAYLRDADLAAHAVDAIPERRFRIIDVHEHLQTDRDASLLLSSMDALGVRMSCLQGSSFYTFTLDDKYGFERFHENNQKLLELKKKHPGRFCAFVTLNPPDADNLERLKRYVANGADGLKLYLGHGAKHGKGPFHMMALNDARMRPVYAYAQKIQLPITLHVNLINYWDEMVAVLEEFPYLRVNIPHFGLHKNTNRRLARLAWLLRRYPNVYTDISFGWQDFHRQGFESLAGNPERSQKFFADNQQKILFASDLVIEKNKTPEHVTEVLRSYMQLLEMKSFRFFMVPDHVMRGLALSDEILRIVYEETPARFLVLDDAGALRDRAGGWPQDGERVPGLPPAVDEVKPVDPSKIPP